MIKSESLDVFSKNGRTYDCLVPESFGFRNIKSIMTQRDLLVEKKYFFSCQSRDNIFLSITSRDPKRKKNNMQLN